MFVVVSATMVWLIFDMQTEPPKLPLPSGWWKQRIFPWEAEWQLDANAYLWEQWWWAHGRLHHEYLCQQMFLHATATGQHEHAICQGQRKPLPEWDLWTEPTAMELIGPDSMCQDIKDLYQDVYQLWRLPGRGHCEEAMEEHICKELLDSIKEYLWDKQPSAQLEGEQMQLPVNAPQPDTQMAFAATNHSMSEKFTAIHWLIWGDDDPHERCPSMGPCGSCIAGRMDGEVEPLY